MTELVIRTASTNDAAALLEIYSHYVTDTAVTFEYDVPTAEEFAGRIRDTLRRYPYLVAESGGEIIGYAYAGVFKARPAYDWAVETTIYIRHDKRRTGVGRALYEALEKALTAQNIVNLYACIASPIGEDEYLTRDSIEFHSRVGYTLAGHFRKCGYKFGRWYDMVWMEKMIGGHISDQPAVIPYRAIEVDGV